MSDERPDLKGFPPPIRDANLTQLMWELAQAFRDEGSGQESDIEKVADVRYRIAPMPHDAQRPERSIHNHYAGGFDALEARGIIEKDMVGRERYWWLIDEAARAFGRRPIVRPAGLF